ncbi:MAG TPA: protein kinase, partial [Nitrolancea sp.]|nr:protein kinase [Nitrolancea sp.]
VLDARIGEGTFAEIYRATDTQTGSLVAVKTLRPEQAATDNAIALFRQEGEIGSSLSHTNVVKVWTYGETAGTYFIVMELVTGISLRRRMKRATPISVAEAFRIIRAVLCGLEAIHTAGYIHRDIKPQNILIEANGTPKITDFGITLRAGGIRAPGDGTTLGTAAYIAPEQAAGWEIGPQADLYAAGVVLYEMLTGQVPFPGNDPIEVMHRHMFETPRDPRALNPDVSPALSAVVLRALEKEPEARFASAQAMYDALAMIHVNGDVPNSRPERNPATPKAFLTRRKRVKNVRSRFLTTFVSALLLAVLILVVILALVSTAVTADNLAGDVSRSSLTGGFVSEAPTAVSTPHPIPDTPFQIPVAAASNRPPNLTLFDNVPSNNPARHVPPAESFAAPAKPTPTPRPSPTPNATASATPRPTVTPPAKPPAAPDKQVAQAQVPPPPVTTTASTTTKKPVAPDANASASNTPPDSANKKDKEDQAPPGGPANNGGNSVNNTGDASNSNQPINSGFGATQNVTNKPDKPSGPPVVNNSGPNQTVSGQPPGPPNNADSSNQDDDNSNSQSADDSGNSNHHHRHGHG